AAAVPAFVLRADDAADAAEVVNEAREFLAQHGMMMNQRALGVAELFRPLFPALDQLARHTDETDVMNPRADLENLALFGGQIEAQGHGLAQLEHAPRLVAKRGIKRLHGLHAELHGAMQIFLERS